MNKSKRVMQVFYFVPEDGDDESQPNYFRLGSSEAEEVRVCAVREAFPLPGRYHFRFKRAFKNTYVWLDVWEDSEVVPKFEGRIFAKVTRLEGGGQGIGAEVRKAAPSRDIVETGGESEFRPFSPPKTSSDLLGLSSPVEGDLSGMNTTPPPDMSQPIPLSASPSNGFGGGGAFHHMHSLDWTSSSSTPSPAPSPPLIPTPSTSSETGRLNSSSSATPLRNSSPLRTEHERPKVSNLKIPKDLSSAAKDFKL